MAAAPSLPPGNGPAMAVAFAAGMPLMAVVRACTVVRMRLRLGAGWPAMVEGDGWWSCGGRASHWYQQGRRRVAG